MTSQPLRSGTICMSSATKSMSTSFTTGHVTARSPACPAWRNATIIINGFSKSYAMTGWRLAWLAAPLSVAKLARTYMTQTVTSAASFSMVAGAVALNGPQECVHEMVASYVQRRNFLLDALDEIPGVLSSPHRGGFLSLCPVHTD